MVSYHPKPPKKIAAGAWLLRTQTATRLQDESDWHLHLAMLLAPLLVSWENLKMSMVLEIWSNMMLGVHGNGHEEPCRIFLCESKSPDVDLIFLHSFHLYWKITKTSHLPMTSRYGSKNCGTWSAIHSTQRIMKAGIPHVVVVLLRSIPLFMILTIMRYHERKSMQIWTTYGLWLTSYG